MFASDEEDGGGDVDVQLFQEPEGYYKPEIPPSFDSYDRIPKLVKQGEPSRITLRLVGKSPLWGHLLWNASKASANYLDRHGAELILNKNVLEVGAGAGLPSFISGINGASKVVITDYPEPELLENIQYNVDHALGDYGIGVFNVAGYVWGDDVTTITKPYLDQAADGFDLIILSDVVFNHSEHDKLLKTCTNALSRSNKQAKIFVVFTPHRPWLFDRDLQFFELAKSSYGFKVEKLFEEKWKPMFEEDEETKELRSMVFGYYLYF
ncbi:hypothetical protein V1514DRAFT_336354 [Lipomyces japonicus]|uniref:uncharacterized protein n=1 Tax=Lipomyces japonicus TaxID=56871 RepID=UPI0034CE3743